MTSYKGPSDFDSISARDQEAAMAKLWAAHGHPHAVDWAAVAGVVRGGELRFIAKNRDFEAVDGLLRAGLPPAAFAEAASQQAMCGHVFAQYFLDRVDLAGNQDHLTAALYAACERREHGAMVPVVRRLLALGADPSRPHGNSTPLGAALLHDHHVAEVLLVHGARPDAQQLRGAIMSGSLVNAALLLAHGAPMEGVDALIEEGKAAKQKAKQATAIAMEALVKEARERR